MQRILIGNIKGPQGAQGIQGPQGPVGATGPQGPMPDLVNNALATEAGVAALDAVMGKTLQDQITQLNSNFAYIDVDMTSASVATEFKVQYPSGFSRANSVVIGVAGYHKQYRVWYGYTDESNIIVILAEQIIIRAVTDDYVGTDAKVRIALMKV